jgi:hypothetical protein
LGIGDWGLGPIPNPHFMRFKNHFIILLLNKIKIMYKKRIKYLYHKEYHFFNVNNIISYINNDLITLKLQFLLIDY